MLLRRILFLGLLLLVPAGAGRGDQAATLVADQRTTLNQGPSQAIGAVIWNHAGEAPRQADSAPAAFVDLFRAAGFDIYKLERPAEGDKIRASTQALIKAAQDLRARGYGRIVLAGQSAGGWISFGAAATMPGMVDAIVATAPAAYGRVADDPVRAARNRDDLLRMVARLERTRVMVFLFEGDEFDPGERGAGLVPALTQRGIPNLVIDRPAGWRGHGVGLSRAFARRFGPCIVAFTIATGTDPVSCDRFADAKIPFEFADIPEPLPQPANDNTPVGGFIGAWRGWLDNGDDVMLIVEGGPSEQVRGVFARGRSRLVMSDKPFVQRRIGRFDPELRSLVFQTPKRPAVTAVLTGTGQLRLSVVNIAGDKTYRGELVRVEPESEADQKSRLSP